MKLSALFLFSLTLIVSACASEPRKPDENWSVLSDNKGNALAAFSKDGTIEFYSSKDEAFRALLGVVGQISQNCPAPKADVKADPKAGEKKASKSKQPKAEAPKAAEPEKK